MKAALALPAAFCLLFILLSPASAQDVQLPAQPTGLTASEVAEAVSLEWDEPGDSSITGYQVLRRSRDGAAYGDDQGAPEFAVIADDTGSAETQYRDASVTPGARYVYRIKARNAAGLSPWSSYANAETLTAPAFQAKDAVPRSDTSTCPDSTPPTPLAVTIDAIPIVVSSTTAEYFVLYVSHVIDADTTVETPVAVTRGAAGTTTLSENVAALPKERYRVEKYLIADPADVDGDCIDDLTELGNLGSMNPVNPAGSIDLNDGAVAVPDQATLKELVYGWGAARSDLKFLLVGLNTEHPRVYFTNTNTHPSHDTVMDILYASGIEERGADVENGLITYHRDIRAANGELGVYVIWVYSIKPFSYVDLIYTLFAASMPVLEDNLAYNLPNYALLNSQDGLPLYKESRINVVFDADLAPESDFIPLNEAEGYGLLRVMNLDERPNSRDVVIYEALPNELPRVAGIITTVPQAPLSHVNLRAVQDGVPNAFIRNARDDDDIAALVGSYVHYTVTKRGYTIRAATRTEVDDHHASSRPTLPQTPQRDLSVTAITPLGQIGFDDWDAFGVKAANVAELRKLGLPSGTVPDGFAIPFYFYDEFMKHNDFYTRIRAMLADADFQGDIDNAQEKQLKALRDAIEDAETPQWIIDALVQMNEGFPSGINRRYRSSTNNEDLPGFNGAGLYDSKSQKPSEDEDDLAKSLKEVYASLWNSRAFIERDFHRVDHLKTAMGVLVHPSYQDELVNGVAVSFDPVTGRDGSYYVNSQVGEDLVTNPDAHSVPEEVLLRGPNSYAILRTSNQLPAGQLLMSAAQLQQLRQHLGVIHTRFKALYKPAAGKPFAMEIEFKITSDNVLAIKQARPWVFGSSSSGSGVRPPIITRPTIVTRPTIITGGGGGGGGCGPSGPTPSDVDFEWTVKRDLEAFDGGNDWPTGLWSDGAVLWVAENGQGADDAVYAYDLSTGERLEEQEFELAETNRAPRGFWSDGVTVRVSDSGQDRLFAYDLASGDRLPERDIALASRNADARGLWSGSETVWVLDGGKNALFAYDLGNGELLAEHALDDANGDPRGIWSDGVTVWVSDHGAKRLFAYRLPDAPAPEDADAIALERMREEEFSELSRASNNSPRGIWANDHVMYVADESDDRVYSYNMPDAIDARLASLTLSGIDIGAFSGSTTEYEAVVGEGVTETTVEAEAMQRRTKVVIEPSDATEDAEGHQVTLAGLEAITVSVTSADGSRTRVYRVQLEAPASVLKLSPTWTSIEWPGADGLGIAEALGQAGILDKVLAIYRWDAATSVWLAFFPSLGDVPGLNTLTTLEPGQTYWFAVTEPLTWTLSP